MPSNFKTTASIAAAAATMIMAGAGFAPEAQAKSPKGHCFGANSCKGHGACKSAANDCKGENACKGKGFVDLTKRQCAKIAHTKFVTIKKG